MCAQAAFLPSGPLPTGWPVRPSVLGGRILLLAVGWFLPPSCGENAPANTAVDLGPDRLHLRRAVELGVPRAFCASPSGKAPSSPAAAVPSGGPPGEAPGPPPYVLASTCRFKHVTAVPGGCGWHLAELLLLSVVYLLMFGERRSLVCVFPLVVMSLDVQKFLIPLKFSFSVFSTCLSLWCHIRGIADKSAIRKRVRCFLLRLLRRQLLGSGLGSVLS